MIHQDYDSKYNFYIVSCDDGEYITSYNDEDDIRNFFAFTVAYCPVDIDLRDFRTIGAEEYADYMIEKDKAIEKDREDKENDRRRIQPIE